MDSIVLSAVPYIRKGLKFLKIFRLTASIWEVKLIEFVKNILFDSLVTIGLIAICLVLIWCILELMNRIFKFTKYIIMYRVYRRNIELYDLKDKVIVSRDGTVLCTCITDLDKQIEILEKAIQNRKEMKILREKYSK